LIFLCIASAIPETDERKRRNIRAATLWRRNIALHQWITAGASATIEARLSPSRDSELQESD
jgi:hypothetical protein